MTLVPAKKKNLMTSVTSLRTLMTNTLVSFLKTDGPKKGCVKNWNNTTSTNILHSSHVRAHSSHSFVRTHTHNLLHWNFQIVHETLKKKCSDDEVEDDYGYLDARCVHKMGMCVHLYCMWTLLTQKYWLKKKLVEGEGPENGMQYEMEINKILKHEKNCLPLPHSFFKKS